MTYNVLFASVGRRPDCQKPSDGRWHKFSVREIMEWDKMSLDVFWTKDKVLANLDSLPPPEELAADTIENLQSTAFCTFLKLAWPFT